VLCIDPLTRRVEEGLDRPRQLLGQDLIFFDKMIPDLKYGQVFNTKKQVKDVITT
jgi:hypothetical protein